MDGESILCKIPLYSTPCSCSCDGSCGGGSAVTRFGVIWNLKTLKCSASSGPEWAGFTCMVLTACEDFMGAPFRFILNQSFTVDGGSSIFSASWVRSDCVASGFDSNSSCSAFSCSSVLWMYVRRFLVSLDNIFFSLGQKLRKKEEPRRKRKENGKIITVGF